MGSVNDIVNEVPQESNDDEDVVDPEEGHSASQGLGRFLRGVVEDLETEGVVVVLPVYLMRLVVLAARLDR